MMPLPTQLSSSQQQHDACNWSNGVTIIGASWDAALDNANVWQQQQQHQYQQEPLQIIDAEVVNESVDVGDDHDDDDDDINNFAWARTKSVERLKNDWIWK